MLLLKEFTDDGNDNNSWKTVETVFFDSICPLQPLNDL